MLNPLSETTFEAHIANYLANSDLYNQRSSAQFDIERLCDAEMLEQFLRAQPIVWQKLSQHFAGRETETVIREYNKRLDRGESILNIMRKGFTVSGAKVKFCQFKPTLEGEGTENYNSIVPIGLVWCARCATLWELTVVTNWTCVSS